MVFTDIATICSGGAPFGQWAFYTFIILVISSSIYGFLYFLSKFLNSPKLSVEVSQEILQMFYTVFLFVLLLMFYTGMCNIDIGSFFDTLPGGSDYSTYYCGTSPDACKTPYDYGSSYLKKVNEWGSETIILTAAAFSLMSSLGSTKASGSYQKAEPFTGLKQIADSVLNLAMMSLIIIFFSSLTQMIILYYSWSPMIGIFLPFAFFLRSFAPTRTIGGAIIGAVLTLSVFYPLLLMINGMVMVNIQPEIALTISKAALGPIALAWVSYGFSNVIIASEGNPKIHNFLVNKFGIAKLGRLAGKFLSFQHAINLTVLVTVLLAAITFIVTLMFVIGSLFIAGVLLPLLNLLILAEISKALSAMLGESLNVANLTRIV